MKANDMDYSPNYRDNAADVMDMLDHIPTDKLKALTSRSAIREHLLARRDALIREVVGELYGHLQRGFAGALATRLKRFYDVGFGDDPKLDKGDETHLRTILVANNNKPLGKRQLQNILNGHRTPPAK